MEKKIEVEINGRKRLIPEHMLADYMKFGATQTKRAVKEPPRELLNKLEPKKVILPPQEVIKEPVKEPDLLIPKSIIKPGDNLPPMEVSESLPKTRKKPVKSKSKK